MAAFCIPVQLAEKLKQAAKAGDIDIAKMYEMDSAGRRELFEKYTDKNTAKEINVNFEKAMVSSQKTALKKWAETVFNAKTKKTQRYKDVLAKIERLDDMGLLTPENDKAFMSDLVADRLGVTVTSDEAEKISSLAKELETLAKEETEFGTPTIEYFKARKRMDDYLDSITPNSRLRVATETIGRGTMLLSIKSPLLNVESNTIQGFLQIAERRLGERKLVGSNSDYAVSYMKFVNDVYKQTGYDISRMESLQNGKRVLGEGKPNAQGKGVIRKVGRFYEDKVFKQLLGAPDVFFASIQFADSANIASAKIAALEGLEGDKAKQRALTILKDATRIQPNTPQGEMVRAQARADAEYATYTNKSVYADIALGIRKLFNIPLKDLRVGDQIMPFVKTPANVIGAGIDASGVLVPADVAIRMTNVLKAIHNGDNITEAWLQNMKGFSRRVIRAGLGLTFAYALSTLFKPEDFIGEYPSTEKERQLLELRQATPNSVKIGDNWISLDYFGAIGAPLVGMLYARKYGKDLPDAVFRYYQGVATQSAKIPGFTEFYNTVKSLKEAAPSARNTLDENLKGVSSFALDFIRARTIPGIVYDFAKASDTVDRKVDTKTDELAKLKSGFPGLRQELPEKRNVFGETVQSQGWKVLLFGARVKTAQKDPLIDELVRLDQTGNLPSITDVSKTSDRAKRLKQQIGEKRFDQAMQYYGKRLKEDLQETITDSDYQEGNDDDKKKLLDNVKKSVFEEMLYEYDYEEE